MNILHVLRTMTQQKLQKIVVLQVWHIFTRTRTTAMLYLKCKIVRTCDFYNRNLLNGFKINSHSVMKGIHVGTILHKY